MIEKVKADIERARLLAEADLVQARIKMQASLEEARALTDQSSLMRLRELQALEQMAKSGAKFVVGLEGMALSET